VLKQLVDENEAKRAKSKLFFSWRIVFRLL